LVRALAGARLGEPVVADQVGEPLGVASVTPADDVVPALLAERVLVPEGRILALAGLALLFFPPERIGAVQRRGLAVLSLLEKDDGGELVHRILLPAGDRQVPEIDQG